MKFVKDRQPLKQTQNATMTDSTEWKLGTSQSGNCSGGNPKGEPRGVSLLVNLCTGRIVFIFPFFFFILPKFIKTVIFYSLASN